MTVDADGFLRLEDTVVTEWIDSSIATEGFNSGAIVVILRLWEDAEQPRIAGATLPATAVRQFRMSPETARQLAIGLVAVADEIEGQATR
ncbi:hypothetical protein [Pararhodobacter sp.]|uniref:hypothetical protein n=1 Tax=Pararhodobacter sp. TaxID=2127056 RepID=UPI002AFF950E|nr:hypothetical protein [Pararhodobacter sp.]